MNCCWEVETIFVNISEKTQYFENILGYESKGQVLLIIEKNQSAKISCFCPLKGHSKHSKFMV